MKSTFIFAFLFFLNSQTSSAQVLPVQDGDFACIDQAAANRYASDLSIDTRSFGGMELCRNDIDTKKLFNDLTLIEKGQFVSQQGPQILIGGFVPADKYYPWLKQQTRGVRRGNDVPYATAYNRMGYFTMQDGWSSLSTLGRVGVLIHEARHSAGYMHTPCAFGPYAQANTPGCDRDFSYGGSHAVEMEYYARVDVLGANFHPVYKSMARLMAMARANFVFNQPVIQKKDALLLQNAETGTPVLMYQGQADVRDTPLISGRLKRTSFGAAIFNGNTAVAVELYGHRSAAVDLFDVYSYFKLFSRLNTTLKDAEEYDSGIKRYFVGLSMNNQISSYDFPRGAWKSPVQVPFQIAKTVTTLEDGQAGYFLIDQAGSIYPFDGENNRLGPALPNKWPSDLESVAYDETHRLVQLKTDASVWTGGTPYLAGKWRGIVSVPVYNAFEVRP